MPRRILRKTTNRQSLTSLLGNVIIPPVKLLSSFWRLCFCGMLIVSCNSIVLADDTTSGDALTMPSRGLTVIDWCIIGLYLVSTIALGFFYSRRQTTTEEYFVGSGKMNPFLIGVSLFATLLSTISYLSMPGESLGKGPVYLASTLAYPFVFLIVAYVLIPVYMKQRVTSAYELLEAKLGRSVRLLGATMFVALRLVWMSLLVFLTAKAITIMIGVDEKWIPAIVMVTGFVAIIYTSLGGLQAVVVTDLMQTVLLYGGSLLVLGTITYQMGGFGWFPTEWDANWDSQPIFSFDPATRITLVGTILNVLVWYVCTSGGDQTSVQRFMATADARAARRAYATQLCVAVVVAITLAAVGFALLGYFKANPQLLPAGMTLKDNADKIFPHFIAYHLPPGVSGLVVAAMFAAAMSSIDSGVNSITAVVVTDLIDPLQTSKGLSERQHVLLSRLLAFGIGAFVVVGSSFMDLIPGNITAVTNKTANLLTTPIFCLFFFALFVPFAKPLGVWIGAIVGTTTAVLIAFSGPIYAYVGPMLFDVHPPADVDPISFQWIAPASLLLNMVTGLVISYLLRDSTTEIDSNAPTAMS